MKLIKENFISFFIPKNITNFPFKKVETPNATANQAKIRGNSSTRPYWFWNICWEALKYNIKEPITIPEIAV